MFNELTNCAKLSTQFVPCAKALINILNQLLGALFSHVVPLGHVGHTVSQVAPLFSGCVSLDNVSLPADFWDVLGLKKMDAGR